MQKVQTIAEALNAIGRKAVMAELGVGKSCVSGWIARGAIPPKRYLPIVEMGKARGIIVPPHLFGMAEPPAKPPPRRDETPELEAG